MSIKNCPICGKIFEYSNLTTVCPECWIKNENDFKKIKDYLYDNPNQNIIQLSEATGIPIEKIKCYMREERIVSTNNTSSSLLDCKLCGKAINFGNYCDDCRKTLEEPKVTSVRSNSSSRSVRMHTRSSNKR